MRTYVGVDPEFFLQKDGKNVAAVGIVPGTKAKPFPLRKGAVQLDGTAVEFNTTPAITSLGFSANIKRTLADVRKLVPKDYAFDFSPSVVYDKEYFDTLPEDSKILGCDPDFDAYSEGQKNEPPDNKTTMRTAAGHIHTGWGKGLEGPDHVWDCCEIVKLQDLVYYPMAYLWDRDERREQMYGKAGAFRPKSYGVEYRSLSCAWLKYPKLYPWIHEVAKWSIRMAKEGKSSNKYNDGVYVRNLLKIYKNSYGYDTAEVVDKTYSIIANCLAVNKSSLPAFPVNFE